MRELKHLGLSDKEASVYLASLEMGPSSVQDLSHKSKVNRATTYVMIESLINRGLMSTFIKGKKRYYAAETPERLMSILNMQQKELVQKQEEFKDVLPLLMALYNVEGAKPQIRYLEGTEGLKTVQQMFSSLKGEFLQIVPFDDVSSIEEIIERQPEHMRQFSHGLSSYKAILVMEHPNIDTIPHIPNGEIRVISSEKFPIHGEITVRENHVFLYSYKSSILSVVITSKEIADAVRALFNLAWDGVGGSVSRRA